MISSYSELSHLRWFTTAAKQHFFRPFRFANNQLHQAPKKFQRQAYHRKIVNPVRQECEKKAIFKFRAGSPKKFTPQLGNPVDFSLPC